MCGVVLSVLGKPERAEPGTFLDPTLVFLGWAIGEKTHPDFLLAELTSLI